MWYYLYAFWSVKTKAATRCDLKPECIKRKKEGEEKKWKKTVCKITHLI